MATQQEEMLVMQEQRDLFLLERARELEEHIAGDRELPMAAYASMQVKDDSIDIAEATKDDTIKYTKALRREDAATEMLNWLRQTSRQRYLQWIAAAIQEEDHPEDMFSRLWLQEDIVPFIIRKQDEAHQHILQEQVRDVASNFDENDIVLPQFGAKHEIQVSKLVTLKDHQKTASAE